MNEINVLLFWFLYYEYHSKVLTLEFTFFTEKLFSFVRFNNLQKLTEIRRIFQIIQWKYSERIDSAQTMVGIFLE